MSQPASSSARLNRLLAFVELDAGNLNLRKQAVREAFSIGYWDTARRLLDVGLEAHPQEGELLALSGFSHLQSQRYGDAEDALSNALNQGLDAAEIHYNLAFVQFRQKRYPEALALLAPAVTAALPMALVLRARCQHHLGQRADAIIDCKAHLVVAPDDGETHGLLGLLLYEQEQYEEARSHIEAALRYNPKQLEAMLVSASLQSDSQHYDAARSSFDTLLQTHPECGRAWLGLALIELTHMQVHAAKRDIELAATHMPEHIGTWHVLAWIHIMLGDILAAELAFDRALGVDRNFGETHGGLAVIAALQGREDDARASIKRALRLDSQSMSAQYAEMLIMQRHGQHNQAQAVLEAILTRPMVRSDQQYRDLVTKQIDYLRARIAEDSDRLILH